VIDLDPARNANYQPTSKAAAMAMRGKVTPLQAQVFRALAWCRDVGAINEELHRLTRIRLDTVKPRCNELWEMGLIYLLADVRRPGEAGTDCQVWVVPRFLDGRPTTAPRRNRWKKRAIKAEATVEAYRDLYGDLLFQPR